MGMVRCMTCENAIAGRLPRPIADALLEAGIHLGNTTGGYKIEPTETEGIYRFSMLVAAEYVDDLPHHRLYPPAIADQGGTGAEGSRGPEPAQ